MWVKATAEHCWINLNHASYVREEDDARLHVHELPGFTEVPAIDEAFMDFERRIYDQIIPAAPGQFAVAVTVDVHAEPEAVVSAERLPIVAWRITNEPELQRYDDAVLPLVPGVLPPDALVLLELEDGRLSRGAGHEAFENVEAAKVAVLERAR
jgi:hypothetical protein